MSVLCQAMRTSHGESVLTVTHGLVSQDFGQIYYANLKICDSEKMVGYEMNSTKRQNLGDAFS